MSHHERMFHHEHAHKLDDPERRVWLPVDEVLEALGLGPGMVVTDIGAGTGYFALPMAAAVAPLGRVYAVDLQPEMLAELRKRTAEGAPVELVEADAARTTLATGSQDLVFSANVWHELDDRNAALTESARLLRPGGKLAIVDWRTDVDQPPGPPLEHRVGERLVVEQLLGRGWTDIESAGVGRYGYLVTARRPGPGGS
ncbi:MAG: methyltransferase domain-containing protein [Polyangiaceae bacterium]|nr:methyltransferase domain-containing protein [Polyangiaceae bacterium]